MKKTDLAYIAGLMDGEAYIGIKKSKAYKCQGRHSPGYHARIQIRMVDEPAIKFVAENLGGWYYKEAPHAAKGRPLYCYSTSDKKAAEILRQLLPFLRVKYESAKTVLSFRTLQATSAKHRTKVIGTRNFPNKYGTPRTVQTKALSDEYIAQCEAYYLRCKELNRVGI